MTDDRDYWFLVKCFSAPRLSPQAFLEVANHQMSDFLGYRCSEAVCGVDVFHKTGDVELQTDKRSVRDWEYCIISQLTDEKGFARLCDDRLIEHERTQLHEYGVEYLSSELMQRPAHAGTATPGRSPQCPVMPENFSAAIEYIYIPPDRWVEYKDFMRDVIGPIERHMLEAGKSHRMIIMELSRAIFHDPSLPKWNRIHVLTGDFDDSGDGFLSSADAAARAVIGEGESIETALSRANGYRSKPRMSKNALIFSCTK